ncbi:aldehyde dehydrogenase family protein, partial [Rhizorhabdus dicambivorans]
MEQLRGSFFIGGDWVEPASDRRFTLVDASSGEAIGTVPEGVEADIDAAVAAARKALHASGWADASPAERASVIERFLAALTARSEDIARSVSTQNGMPIAVSRALEGGFSLGLGQYYVDLARSLGQPDIRPSQMGRETRVEHSPIGVVAAIIPWNFPVTLAISKIA